MSVRQAGGRLPIQGPGARANLRRVLHSVRAECRRDEAGGQGRWRSASRSGEPGHRALSASHNAPDAKGVLRVAAARTHFLRGLLPDDVAPRASERIAMMPATTAGRGEVTRCLTRYSTSEHKSLYGLETLDRVTLRSGRAPSSAEV